MQFFVLSPKTPIFIYQYLLQASLEGKASAGLGWWIRPPGIKLTHPVQVPLASLERQSKLADGKQEFISIRPLLNLVHAQPCSFIRQAQRAVVLQRLTDCFQSLPGHIRWNDIRVANRFQSIVVAVFISVEVIDDFVDGQVMLASILLQLPIIVNDGCYFLDDLAHRRQAAAAGLPLVPLI